MFSYVNRVLSMYIIKDIFRTKSINKFNIVKLKNNFEK